MDDREARELVARIEGLLESDPSIELVQAVVELYGEGLRRIVAAGMPRELASDEVIGHLLLLHGLHPVPVEERVGEALAEVMPYLESHGGGVELLDVDEGVVRLRLEGTCNGCPSSSATLKLAIEDAIQKHAPDIERVEEASAGSAPGLIQLEVSDALQPWREAGAMAELPDAPVVRDGLLMVRLGRGAYAYRPGCAVCGAGLAGAELDGVLLACPECGSRFDVRHAGRCVDAPGEHLEPVPLLVDPAGAIRVAQTA
jgi:Fe-S cluster biogenesis protein NfuA/nitrite reductase/ring-hydroxylating ferredoxin subunit